MVLRENHPTTPVLQPAINVSPLIRGARWVALGAGVLWGAYRLTKVNLLPVVVGNLAAQIREYHADIRDFEHEQAVAKAQEQIRQKKWLNKEEMRLLFKAIGVPFHDGVAQFGAEDLYREP